jgi:Flp pilus assembly pilin Flp
MHGVLLGCYAVRVLSTKGVARRVCRFLLDDGGQGLVEYALIIATVALVAIAAFNLLGHRANNSLDHAASNLS